MGDRAVIAFKDERKEEDNCPAIYLHWNGKKCYVEAFLRAAKEFGIRGDDPTYCIARLTQVIGNTIGGTLSLGVGCYRNFGNPGDNGVFWIKNWEIVEHETNFGDDDENKKYQAWHEEAYHDTLEANKDYFERGAKVQ